MITVHHLGISQSERIVWLCEELGIPYELKIYARDPATRLAPAQYKALHPMGIAPLINDADLLLGESAAIVEYIITRYGDGKLTLPPSHPDYASYLYWFHFSNGQLQPTMSRNSALRRTQLPQDNATIMWARAQLDRVLALMDARLKDTPFLAGSAFTAADIMSVFSLTTMRTFMPVDLSPYPHIKAYLQRIGKREAYVRAMAKGDPGFTPMLD